MAMPKLVINNKDIVGNDNVLILEETHNNEPWIETHGLQKVSYNF